MQFSHKSKANKRFTSGWLQNLGNETVIALMAWAIPGHFFAQTGPDGTTQINALNTVWTLVAVFLVFCMQVDFVMLKASFARSREAANILVEGIANTCLCGIMF